MIKVCLFDLGGVLVDARAIDGLTKLSAGALSAGAIEDRWLASELVRDFELGLLTPEAFAAQFLREWQIDVETAGFLAEFTSWTHALLPGAAELVSTLRRIYSVAALSNSNVLHWTRNTDELGVTGLFETAYSSHVIGFRKPDPAAFEWVLNDLNVLASEVAFFDDNLANVKAARSIGMAAWQVKGVEETRAALVKAGLWRPDSEVT